MSLLSKSGQTIVNSHSHKQLLLSNNIRSSYNFENAKQSKESFTQIFRKSDTREHINEANKVMLERMKHKGSSINTRSLVASVILKNSKQIGLHNYMIENLRHKRTEINQKVKTISKALKDSGGKLDCDFKEFVEFVEQTNREQKKREEELATFKSKNENLIKMHKIAIDDYKKNTEDLEKTIRILSLLKSYGAFVHRVLNIPFSYSNIPDIVDNKEKQYDELSSIILKDYDKMIHSKRPAILEDESLLLTQFITFEDKVIKIMDNKHVIDKEVNRLSQSYVVEIEELKNREKNIIRDVQNYNEEKSLLINGIKHIRTHRHNDVEKNLGYIMELGREICGLKDRGKKRNFLESLKFTKDSLDVLSEKEKIVNAYIKEIEQSEITDEEEIRIIVGDRKKTNKKDKQMMMKIKQELLDTLKRQRAEERARRVVIKGKKVPKNYMILKQKMNQRLEDMVNENDDYNMLNYSSEDN